jgi:hypothetical protein
MPQVIPRSITRYQFQVDLTWPDGPFQIKKINNMSFSSESEFLYVIGTKVLGVFLLANHSHLY